jgi:hypothetical protein
MWMSTMSNQSALASTSGTQRALRKLGFTSEQELRHWHASWMNYHRARQLEGLFGRHFLLPESHRDLGIHIMAGKGSGKSRLMGRAIAWQDFRNGHPLVILDPVGATIDNFLDKLIRLSRKEQLRRGVPDRITYVDMSGQGERVVPFPLYYRLGDESLFEVAQRYPQVLAKIDPHLASAPILGLNAVVKTGTYVGMLLAAMGCQITEAEHLLREPKLWRKRIERASIEHPDIGPAADFFLHQYPEMSPKEQRSLTDSFSAKVGPFALDPQGMATMFGPNVPGIDWDEVIAGRRAVLLDFRHEHNLTRRRFKMMWAFSYLMDFIKHRGAGRQHRPVSVIIDELTELTDMESLGVNPFAKELNELINVYARNCRIFLTIAHQEAFQVDDYTLQTLMTMGTQIVGVVSDFASALRVAEDFFPIDPHKVKRWENVWGHDPTGPYVIEKRAVDYTADEQMRVLAYYFKTLQPFHFLIRRSRNDGGLLRQQVPVDMARYDQGQWVDEDRVALLRRRLAGREGIPSAQILKEIRARTPSIYTRAQPAFDKMVADDEQFYDPRTK